MCTYIELKKLFNYNYICDIPNVHTDIFIVTYPLLVSEYKIKLSYYYLVNIDKYSDGYFKIIHTEKSFNNFLLMIYW